MPAKLSLLLLCAALPVLFAQPPAATYILGPDDQIVVRVLYLDEIPERPFRVDMAGNINVPLVGRLRVAGLTLDAAIKKVRGPKDTAVVLTVIRGAAAPVEIRIVRDTIFQPQVTTRDLAGGTIRYIQVAAFSDRAAADFAASVRAGIAQGERNFIVDLRDNGGGYVTAARTIASQFIASGPSVAQLEGAPSFVFVPMVAPMPSNWPLSASRAASMSSALM